MSSPLNCLIAAAYTPFTADGSLNLSAVDRQLDYFLRTGVGGVFVAGTTGEGHSLTIDERLLLAHKWCTVAKGKMPVVVHVGHNCLRDARTLALRAQVSGAQAIGAIAPFAFKPETVVDLVDYLAEIAAAAPSLPFYYYHIPVATGVNLNPAEVLRVGAERIPTLRGIKYTSYDLMGFLECHQLEGGRFELLYGHDEMFLPSLTLGADGAIGSTYNYAAPVYCRLWEAFRRGDLATAQQEQSLSVKLIRALIPLGVLRAGKLLMKWCGVDCGDVRLPLKPLTAAQEEQLYSALCELDVFGVSPADLRRS